MTERAYVIVLTWNNYKDTIPCLESVFKSSYPDFRVVLVDNGSDDGSPERIKQWARLEGIPFIEYDEKTAKQSGAPPDYTGPLVIIRNEMDYGVPGNNSGLEYALSKGECKYIWLLNNDVLVAKDALSGMINLARSDERIGVVGSKLIYYDKPGFLQAAGGGRLFPWLGTGTHSGCRQEDKGQWDSPYSPDFVTGASMLLKAETLRKTGNFDMNYFLLWEDMDLNMKARRSGYKIMYCPRSVVIHKEGSTNGRINPVMDYYWVRNGLYFAKKFYPLRLPIILLSYLVKYSLVRLLRRQPSNFKSYVKGVADFLRGKTGPA